jgi:hypothetical protein
MKLSEVVKQKPSVPTAEERIHNWLRMYDITDYTIRSNGVVDVRGGCDFSNLQETELPVQFGYVDGSFDCYSSRLQSFTGFPNRIGGNLYLYDSHVYSLHGIEKVVTHVGGIVSISPKATHILGLLLFEVGEISVDDDGPIDDIMNKYINTGDIIGAQDELLDAGFKDQARL